MDHSGGAGIMAIPSGVGDERQTGSGVHDGVHLLTRLLRHEADDGEDDEAGEDARAAVDECHQ